MFSGAPFDTAQYTGFSKPCGSDDTGKNYWSATSSFRIVTMLPSLVPGTMVLHENS